MIEYGISLFGAQHATQDEKIDYMLSRVLSGNSAIANDGTILARFNSEAGNIPEVISIVQEKFPMVRAYRLDSGRWVPYSG